MTTKLGLDPPRRSRRLDLAKRLARGVVAVAPSLRRVARRQASRMVQGGPVRGPEGSASLQTSLRELGTDRVDLLLLHECGPQDATDEMLAFLRDCQSEGRVGAFGIATTAPEHPLRAGGASRGRGAAVQVANSVTAPVLVEVPELEGRALITHSALAGGLDEIHRRVTGSRARATRWSQALGADVSDRRILGELMLTWALLAHPDGVVLFSSRDSDTVRANAALAETESRQGSVEALQALVRARGDQEQPGRVSERA